MGVILRCPVRGCTERLNREGVRWLCLQNHAFDQHRNGSLNLLQPQDRRSRTPGDSREVAAARRRLAGRGHAAPVYQALGSVLRSRLTGNPASLLDVGCGEGSFLGSLEDLPSLERHGLDISAPSIALAAKTWGEARFVVGNADRFLPYADRSFDVITSIDARTNAREFDRVLTERGLVLVAVPGADDLVELRERIQGGKVEKSRTARVEEELASPFRLADQMTVRVTRSVDPPDLRDLLAATYRGFRQSEGAAVAALTPMRVTLSHDILAFERP